VRTRLMGLLGVAATAVLVGGATASAGAAPVWDAAPPVPVPPGTIRSVLNDVTVLAPDDVWAVGGWVEDITTHPLIVHFDGTAWTLAPEPEPASTGPYNLAAVDGVDTGEVWAVGGTGDSLALLRYDGTTWGEAPAPSLEGLTGALADVDMLSADDGWAVGLTTEGGAGARPLILRWVSGQWTRVAAPAMAAESHLTAVFAASADDAWAVGEREEPDGTLHTLVLHFKGGIWQEVNVPDSGGVDRDRLWSVDGAHGSDVWAVGSSCDPDVPTACRPIVVHLSQGVWRRVPVSTPTATLTDVVAFGPNDVWIVGHVVGVDLMQRDHAEHWDGRRLIADLTLRTVTPPVTGDAKPASALALAAAAGETHGGVLWGVGWSQGVNVVPHAVRRS
jgi:hypothetical protein